MCRICKNWRTRNNFHNINGRRFIIYNSKCIKENIWKIKANEIENGNLFKGIPVGSNEAIMRLEMDGLINLFDGDKDNSIILGGSITGRIHNIPKVRKLFDNIIANVEKIIRELPEKMFIPEIKI